jgi:uncharacterized protein
MIDIIKTILADFHQRELPKNITERNLTVPLNSNKIISIIGPRRTGKTWYLYSLIQQLRTTTDIHKIIYINFEDERMDLKKGDFQTIIDAYQQLYPSIELSKVYFFFDEIQEVEGWEKFVRRIHESISRRIFLTGSSAKLMSSEIATSLRGRAVSYLLLPFSFSEYLRYYDISENDVHSSKNKNRIISQFDTYIKKGGYPETFEYDDEFFIKTMQSYVDIMLYRDIIERHSVKNIHLVKDMLRRLIESNGNIFSVNKYYNDLKSRGMQLSKDFVYDLLGYFEDAYTILPVLKHHDSLIKQERAMKKFYINDIGIVTAYQFTANRNSGWFLETFVLLEITKKGLQAVYFSNGFETDFLIHTGGKVTQAIQVCYDFNNDNWEREVQGLTKAMDRFNLDTGFLITNSREEQIQTGLKTIQVVPAWKWSLRMLEEGMRRV